MMYLAMKTKGIYKPSVVCFLKLSHFLRLSIASVLQYAICFA